MTADRHARRTRRRRGFGLVELAASGVIFAAMAAITAQVVGAVAAEAKAAARREHAARLAGDVMERALARDWAGLTTEALAPLADSALAADPIPGASIRFEVVPTPAVGRRGQKRVVVEVRWPDHAKAAEAPVRLVAWTLEGKGARP